MPKNISALLFVGMITLSFAGVEAAHAEEVEPVNGTETTSEVIEGEAEAIQLAGVAEEGGYGEVTGLADTPEATADVTADGVTGDPEAARDRAVYDVALKSIEKLNKRQALEAALAAVDAQIDNFSAWVNIPFGIIEIEGNFSPWGFEVVGSGSIKQSLYCALKNITSENCGPDIVISESFKALIDSAMADSRYSTDEEFKGMVDYDAQIYSYGRTILEQAIPKIDSSFSEYILKTKTDSELIAIANELPETIAYMKPFTFEVLDGDAQEWSLYKAYYAARSSIELETPDETFANYYAILVTAATRVDAEFKVDLAGVESLVTTPTVPNSGSLFGDGDNSAVVVTVALGAVAGSAGLAGLAYVLKSYLFSPLKRRH